MYEVIIKPISGYPRSIINSNRLAGLLQMILGQGSNIKFNSGIFIFNIQCSENNLKSLLDLIRTSMNKQFLDSKNPFYTIEWREINENI